jgi:hypothetical protein
MAATIAAREQDYDVYKAVTKNNSIVVDGLNPVNQPPSLPFTPTNRTFKPLA